MWVMYTPSVLLLYFSISRWGQYCCREGEQRPKLHGKLLNSSGSGCQSGMGFGKICLYEDSAQFSVNWAARILTEQEVILIQFSNSLGVFSLVKFAFFCSEVWKNNFHFHKYHLKHMNCKHRGDLLISGNANYICLCDLPLKDKGGGIKKLEFVRDFLINTYAIQRRVFLFQIISVRFFKIKLDLH